MRGDASAASQKMTQARVRLMLDHPWWGGMALRLPMRESTDTETAFTNGTTLDYNPEYVMEMTDRGRQSLIARMVSHCGFLHPYRMEGRDERIWNKAAGLKVNGVLADAGFDLPVGWEVNHEYDELSTEAIYKILNEAERDGDEGDESGPQGESNEPKIGPGAKSKDKQDGDSEESPDGQGQEPDQNQDPDQGDGDKQNNEPPPRTEDDWKDASNQNSMLAKGRGNMPGNLQREITLANEPKADWRELLAQFVEKLAPSDYSMMPNRRFVGSGIYRPTIIKESLPKLVVAIDTSGSVSVDELNQFGTEVAAIIREAQPEELEVVYCDYHIQGTESFGPDEDVVLHARGGGGTLFQPVFDKYKDDPPVGLIYLTDLCGPLTAEMEPEYPVLWVTPEIQGYRRGGGSQAYKSHMQAPFGQTINLGDTVR